MHKLDRIQSLHDATDFLWLKTHERCDMETVFTATSNDRPHRGVHFFGVLPLQISPDKNPSMSICIQGMGTSKEAPKVALFFNSANNSSMTCLANTKQLRVGPKNIPVFYSHIVLVGGIPTPLKNDGVRQLGLWHSQYDGKVIKFHGSSHHQTVLVFVDIPKSGV